MSQSRDDMMKKWKNWNNQKNYADEHQNFEAHGQIDKRDIMAELVGQMNHQFVENEIKPKKKKEIKFEKTFAKEMEQNTCPICFEQMIPPANSPMILFPCGHSFCKMCLTTIQKKGGAMQGKCALCKVKFVAQAVNISLQNLICIFTDNKNQLEQSCQMVNENDNIEKQIVVNNIEYGDRLKDLDMRLRIMNEESKKMEIEKRKANTDAVDLRETIKIFSDKKKTAMSKLEKLEKEIGLIDAHLAKSQESVEYKDRESQALGEKIQLLKDTIDTLKNDRIKVNIMLNEINNK